MRSVELFIASNINMRSLFLLCFVALGYCLGDEQSGGDLLKGFLNLGMKGRLFDCY